MHKHLSLQLQVTIVIVASQRNYMHYFALAEQCLVVHGLINGKVRLELYKILKFIF